jgi:uncharacterized ubiquitin-like protein YukD
MKKNLNFFRFIRLMMVMIIAFVGMNSCTTDDVAAVEEQEDNLVVFDFTSASELTAWGVDIPANGSGTNISSLSKLSATVTATNAEGANPVRVWATNSGVLDLRIYNGDALTFSVPDNYIITQISWTSANTETMDSWTPNAGTISGGVWTAPEGKTYNSITFKATATTRINVLTFGYELGTANSVAEEIPEPEPDPEAVTFDFTSGTDITAWGVSIPANGSGTNINELTNSLVTLSTQNAEGANPIRIWASNSGVLDLRAYTDDILKISVPDGYIITQISWTSANESTMDSWTPNAGTISGGVWSAPEGKTYKSISFKATGTTRMNVLTVGYQKGTANAVAEDFSESPAVTTEPIEVTLDFTSGDAVKAMGLAIPDNGAGTPLGDPIKVQDFTLKAENAEGANPVRVWATNSGVLDLRSYNGDKIICSVPDGYYISALSWTTANASSIDLWTPSAGTISQGVWTAPEGEKLSSITLTATGTARINVLKATYEKR